MRTGSVRSLRGPCGTLPWALALGLLLGLGGDARADDYRCADHSGIYYGNPRLIKKPAVISAGQVYRHIPEYVEIIEGGLTDKDARYHFLMKKASERFAKAVREMARDLEHDVVGEVGAIQKRGDDAPEPPDRTSEVTQRIGA
jgi:hypothetical protein